MARININLCLQSLKLYEILSSSQEWDHFRTMTKWCPLSRDTVHCSQFYMLYQLGLAAFQTRLMCEFHFLHYLCMSNCHIYHGIIKNYLLSFQFFIGPKEKINLGLCGVTWLMINGCTIKFYILVLVLWFKLVFWGISGDFGPLYDQ